MIKLIASDMDGTLIGTDRKISDKNIESIKKAQELGIHFAISTGRSYEDVEPFLERYDLKCECVTLNGAEYIDVKGNIVEGIYIENKKVIEILSVMEKYDLSVEIYTDNGYYTINSKEEMLNGMIKRTKTFHPELTDNDEIYKTSINHPHFKKMNYITNLDEFINSNIKVGKFVSFADTVEEINKLKEEMNRLEGVSVSSSFITNIEINHEDATKGKILSKAAEKLNIKKEEVAVLGDGSNDYSMFAEFPNSIAMENAIPEIKEIAKYITASNSEDGVGKAIDKILNGEIS